ncbi:TPA: universal stress protein UspF [Escherichia coli]
MNRTILVPIDISDSELTQRVISHVEEEAKIDDAEVHFLTVIPSLPYYASLGLAYSAELPAMDDLKAEAKSQLEEIIKKFKLPTDSKRTARTVLTGTGYSVGRVIRQGNSSLT